MNFYYFLGSGVDLAAVVKICLVLALFCTYPLMMFPVVRILELKLIPEPGKKIWQGVGKKYVQKSAVTCQNQTNIGKISSTRQEQYGLCLGVKACTTTRRLLHSLQGHILMGM